MRHDLLAEADLLALHDAELFEVLMDRDANYLRLGFRNLDHAEIRIEFENILTYRIDNIRYQNVVSRLQMSNVSTNFDEELETAARWTCSGSSGALWSSEEILRNRIENIRDGNLQLLCLDPSCGAEVGVIAETVKLCDDRGR